MKKKLLSKSLLYLVTLAPFFLSGCDEEAGVAQLENQYVELQFVNNSEYDFNYIQGVFKTNYGDFFVNYGGLKVGEKSEMIELPSMAHDVKESYIVGEIAGLEGYGINLGLDAIAIGTKDVPFIGGDYFYVIDLDYTSTSNYIDLALEDTDYVESIQNEERGTRIRFMNDGSVDFTSVVIYVPIEECKDVTLYDYFEREPECRGNFMIPGAEFGYIPAGERTSYIDVKYAFRFTEIVAVTLYGDTLRWYPYDHGPYGLLEEGAYTYFRGVTDNSKIFRDWDDSQFFFINRLDLAMGD